MRNKIILYFFFILSVIGYLLISYFTPREHYIQLFTVYFSLFVASLWLIHKIDQLNNLGLVIGFAIIFRFIFLFSLPALSDDYLRFIWDGQLLAHGINPFNILPKDFINLPEASKIPLSHELYSHIKPLQLNNYTCYPPFNQLFFLIAALLFKNSILGCVVTMRSFIIIAEIGTILIGKRLLKRLNLPQKNILWYALNPLIIIELTGNLHFEGIMLFFLVLALYFVVLNKNNLSSVALAFCASVKLIPIIFLPQFYKRFSFKSLILYYSIFTVVFFLLFSPILSFKLNDTFFQSIRLYFNDFEGNASIYYLIREIGYWITGDNMIEIIGKMMAIIIFIAILLISFLKKNKEPKALIQSMLFAISSYYFLATSVHPWYITPLLILSVFTRFRYAFVWSFFIILTYYTYHDSSFEESKLLVFIEYIAVYAFLIYELFFKKGKVPTSI